MHDLSYYKTHPHAYMLPEKYKYWTGDDGWRGTMDSAPDFYYPVKSIQNLIREFNKDEERVITLRGFCHCLLHFRSEEEQMMFILQMP